MLPSYQTLDSLHLSATIPCQPKMAENRVVDECRLCRTLGYWVHALLYTPMRPSQLLLAENVYRCSDKELFEFERPLRIKSSEDCSLANHEYYL